MDKYISILLIALCIVISPAASRYTMEITAVSYVNPTDEDFDGGECDPEPFGGLCDVYFKFCVRDINSPATNDNCWPDHMVQSSNDITTQNYTFPETGPLYPQAGVSNPITFTSNSAWPGSFQLLVVINDSDTIDDDLVDRNVFNLVLPADGTTSSNMAVLGVFSKATFTARIRISCEQGFSGDDCLTTVPSTTSTTTTSSSPTPTTGPPIELYAGVGAAGIFIVIVVLVIIAAAVVSIFCCQKRRKSPPAYGDHNRYPTFERSNVNPSYETKAALAQGFGVPASPGREAPIYERANNKDYTYVT